VAQATYNLAMRSIAISGAMALLCVAFWPDARAFADGTALPGIRALGTGGAMRAAATGDTGPMLNPSGISLMRSYSADSSYEYGSRDSTHDARISLVDSTSGLNLGGALFYAYHRGSPAGSSQSSQLGGVSLSFPFGNLLFLGGTAKYMDFSTESNGCTFTKSGFTFDAGITVRPMQYFALALVGYNLTNPGISFAPQALGGGVSLSAFPGLLLLLDSVLERGSKDPTAPQSTPPSKAYYVMGGGEYLGETMAARLGGGRDGVHKNGYLSGGLSFVSTVGALDISLRQDVSGERKSTFVGVAARLFVPAK
jgi:hypothetical protein